ncbi:MAG: carbon-nitrogen hydrolase family protein [Isosphaeraceae bacterium]|nr:carbon-nitrogen hydrolase family protein [Isosphaeraceae bacterium]
MSEPTRTIRIAAAQMRPHLGDVVANRHAILGKLREAAAAGARLVVFPECALSGYVFESREEALACAEPIPGPSVLKVAAACQALGTLAVFGMLERDGDRLYNACALVGPEGLVGSYRKIHLPYLGVDRFADPSDRPFAIHEAGGLRVGLLICYDGSFPESGRVLALLGADLLILPTNWPTQSECAAEHLLPCRAMENTVYAMAVNRIGEERGFQFIGRSSIVDPTGARLAFASADREEILYAEIDPARARDKRLVRVPGRHEINRIADRRPRFYAKITEPNGRD